MDIYLKFKGGVNGLVESQIHRLFWDAAILWPGALNYIDTKCGETVPAELCVCDGYVQHLTVYLVNQAGLAKSFCFVITGDRDLRMYSG